MRLRPLSLGPCSLASVGGHMDVIPVSVPSQMAPVGARSAGGSASTVWFAGVGRTWGTVGTRHTQPKAEVLPAGPWGLLGLPGLSAASRQMAWGLRQCTLTIWPSPSSLQKANKELGYCQGIFKHRMRAPRDVCKKQRTRLVHPEFTGVHSSGNRKRALTGLQLLLQGLSSQTHVQP